MTDEERKAWEELVDYICEAIRNRPEDNIVRVGFITRETADAIVATQKDISEMSNVLSLVQTARYEHSTADEQRAEYLEKENTRLRAIVARAEDVEGMAKAFHYFYELNAGSHGWKTQEECRTGWDKLPSANRELMLTTTRAVRDYLLGRE